MISYEPLFHLLVEKKMNKTELRQAAGFTPATLAKLGKGQYVSLEIIEKICKTLNCKIEDVIEIK